MDLALSMVFDSKLAVYRVFWREPVESWASPSCSILHLLGDGGEARKLGVHPATCVAPFVSRRDFAWRIRGGSIRGLEQFGEEIGNVLYSRYPPLWDI
ncbi:MAG: hypothetical protein FD169_2431 [Bacillota bacterium]|nr:MAG: hypothetical protein FD169_2431 [Bacillota bacterium]